MKRNLLHSSLCFICATATILSLAGCGETKEKTQETPQPTAIASTIPEDLSALIKQKESEGATVLKGTIQQMTSEEILEFQHEKDLNPEYKDTKIYTLLILPEPTPLSINGGIDYGDEEPEQLAREARMIPLDNFPNPSKYVGKTVYVSFPKNRVFWATDTSVPIGEPRCTAYEILE